MIGSDHRFDTACRYHDAGQAHAAIEILVELLAERTDEPVYHGVLASCLLMQKRIVAAEHEINIALSLNPDLPFLHETLARILLLKRKPDAAIKACDESLRLNPESASVHLLKASIFIMQENFSAAKGSLDNAANLEPGSVAVAIAYGDHFNTIGKHDVALGYATEALRLNASSSDANILMGETQLALGNSDEADYHAKFAIKQDPNSTAALRLFVNIRMRNNWFVGVWWRLNSWLATLGNLKSALVLIGGFLSFNIFSEIAADLGYATASSFLSSAWLLLVLYSWVGIPMYRNAMARELSKFSFNPKY